MPVSRTLAENVGSFLQIFHTIYAYIKEETILKITRTMQKCILEMTGPKNTPINITGVSEGRVPRSGAIALRRAPKLFLFGCFSVAALA